MNQKPIKVTFKRLGTEDEQYQITKLVGAVKLEVINRDISKAEISVLRVGNSVNEQTVQQLIDEFCRSIEVTVV
jgi:hypothetical protein